MRLLTAVLAAALCGSVAFARPQIIITVTEHGPDTISGPAEFIGPLPGPGLAITLQSVIDLYSPTRGSLVLCEGAINGGTPNKAGQQIGTSCVSSDSDILVFNANNPKLSYQSDADLKTDQAKEVAPPADVASFTLQRPEPIRFISESANPGGVELTAYDPDLGEPGSVKFESTITGNFVQAGYNIISDDPTFVPEPSSLGLLSVLVVTMAAIRSRFGRARGRSDRDPRPQ